MPEVRVLFVTTPPDLAADLVRTLVQERLIACGNIVPGVRSIYAWNGEVCDEQESVVLLETSVSRVEVAIARLRQLHPYECPKIVVIQPAAVTDDYAAWVVRSTSALGAEIDPQMEDHE